MKRFRKGRSTAHELDYLHDRVRLYLLVMLCIDLVIEVGGFAARLVLHDFQKPDFPAYFPFLRWGTTGLIAVGWAYTRFAKPGRKTLIALESGVTIGLAFMYVHLTSMLPTFGPAFALLGSLLALVVRASLVPSPVARTVAIGVASIAAVSIAATQMLSGGEQPVAYWLTLMGGAFVLATAVTSHVIYGLRRQVRTAERLGQYELGRKLGEGGMGVVYEATHVMLRRPTAVKLLPIDKVGEQTVARFEREVQQTSRLEHPNSVYIYDYGRTPDGQFYYAMEYLDGVTLEELVAHSGAVPEARVLRILRQAANALAEAHAIGLVHRDIKPANIMLCERAKVPDTVKVLDFGLVKSVDDAATDGNLTHANTVVGTPHYLAPEAISDPDDVGPASDIYALGAVGFYLLTGRELFTGKSVIEICAKHLNETPESPSEVLGREVNAELEALLLRCLEKQPDERPKDGAVLAQELEGLELSGWSLANAREWWRDFSRSRVPAVERTPSGRTQLAIEVEGRA